MSKIQNEEVQRIECCAKNPLTVMPVLDRACAQLDWVSRMTALAPRSVCFNWILAFIKMTIHR